MDYENNIRKAVDGIKDMQMQKLQQLYAMDPADLRKVERSMLIELSAAPDWAAEEMIPDALSAVGIAHSYSCWRKIKEQLPSLSYLFIDWDSARSVKQEHAQSGYQTAVSHEEQKAFDAGIPIAVAGATLVAGTVAVVNLIVGTSVAVTVVSVLASVTGGLLLKKINDDRKEHRDQPSKPSGKPVSAPKKETGIYDALIRAAYKANAQILDGWCDQLLSATLAVCQEELQ